FIEIREFGSDAIIARSLIQMQKHIFGKREARRRRHFSNPLSSLAGERPHVTALSDIAPGDFCEVYFTRDGLHIKRTTMSNVATPYVIRNRMNEGDTHMIAV